MVSCFVIVIIIVVISIMIHVYIVTYVDIIFSMYIFITMYEQGTIFICPFYNCLKKHFFFLFPRKKIKIKIVSIYVSISNSISREGSEWRGSKTNCFQRVWITVLNTIIYRNGMYICLHYQLFSFKN